MSGEVKALRRGVCMLLKTFDYERKELNQKWLKEIRMVVRKHEETIPEFVDHLLRQLRTENSDSRLALLLLTNHFFQRSHRFRLEIVNCLQDFFLLTLETDPIHFPLPKPAAAATALKKEALEIVRCWVEKFGDGYPKLRNADKVLNASKHFDFRRSNAELQVERDRQAAERLQNDVRQRKTVDRVRQLYADHATDVQKCLTECRNAIELIFPRFVPPTMNTRGEQIPFISATVLDSDLSSRRLHGLDHRDSISIVIPADGICVEENHDNSDLFNALNDSRILMESYLEKVNKWLRKLTEAGDSSSLTRRLIDLKSDLTFEIERCNQLRPKNSGESGRTVEDGQLEEDNLDEFRKALTVGASAKEAADAASEADDDDEFVDVGDEKEGLELDFVEKCGRDLPVPDYILRKIAENEKASTSKRIAPKQSGSLDDSGISVTNFETELPKSVPRLPFGLDLKYWGQKVEPAERARNPYDDHRFWRPPDSEQAPVTESAEAYTSRLITFVGEWRPTVRRMCRAPLPSGKLCPRMEHADRCAIHGPIVPRDAYGFPVHEQPSDTGGRAEANAEEEDILGSEDFRRDVEAATGRVLTETGKRKEMRTKKKKREPTASLQLRDRLKKKLFDPRALKRVTETLGEIQKARAARNFAHQFNYALNNRRL